MSANDGIANLSNLDDKTSFKRFMSDFEYNSPIARGLIGKRMDDAVTIKTPKGDVEYEIIEVEYL